jgi:hypothetical protein
MRRSSRISAPTPPPPQPYLLPSSTPPTPTPTPPHLDHPNPGLTASPLLALHFKGFTRPSMRATAIPFAICRVACPVLPRLSRSRYRYALSQELLCAGPACSSFNQTRRSSVLHPSSPTQCPACHVHLTAKRPACELPHRPQLHPVPTYSLTPYTTQQALPLRLDWGIHGAMADAKSNSVTSSGKRKRAAKITYYAVKQGHTPDIYYSWADVQKQITGHKTPMRRFPRPCSRPS